MPDIEYPYLPEGWEIQYVPEDSIFMRLAHACALRNSKDNAVKTGSVIERNRLFLGMGANGSTYHDENECQRVILGCKTGEGYEKCEGCHPRNHSEATAIAEALAVGNQTVGANLYLWGHWWCCQPCWDTMIGAGITTVYLMEGSEVLFNSEHPNNILGNYPDNPEELLPQDLSSSFFEPQTTKN